MPTLQIQGNNIPYDEKDIISFPHGLIGLPQLNKMVAVRQTTIEPFLWLAGVAEDGAAFVVAEARSLFPAYTPNVPADSVLNEILAEGEQPVVLAIVLIDTDWQKSTVNLRAPIFVSSQTMRGAQIALADNAFSVCEPLPFAAAAA